MNRRPAVTEVSKLGVEDPYSRRPLQDGSWFAHVAQGMGNAREDPNVLFLNYEDMVANFDETLQRIVGFCNLDVLASR
jgi:hypothetical protein